MERLSDKVQVRGVGRDVSSSFVKRNGKVCLYQRSDGPYEVFLVGILPEELIMGKPYPEREVYPSNEDFGSTAWCFTDFKRANMKFNRLADGY